MSFYQLDGYIYSLQQLNCSAALKVLITILFVKKAIIFTHTINYDKSIEAEANITAIQSDAP